MCVNADDVEDVRAINIIMWTTAIVCMEFKCIHLRWNIDTY